MTAFAEVLFQSGRATPLLMARWRSKGALRPLSPNIQLTENGLATELFSNVWSAAFPARTPLPDGALHDDTGHPTIAFHAVFR